MLCTSIAGSVPFALGWQSTKMHRGHRKPEMQLNKIMEMQESWIVPDQFSKNMCTLTQIGPVPNASGWKKRTKTNSRNHLENAGLQMIVFFPACSDWVGMYVYTPTPNFCRVAASLWRFGGKLTRCCDLQNRYTRRSESCKTKYPRAAPHGWFMQMVNFPQFLFRREWQKYPSAEMFAGVFVLKNSAQIDINPFLKRTLFPKTLW